LFSFKHLIICREKLTDVGDMCCAIEFNCLMLHENLYAYKNIKLIMNLLSNRLTWLLPFLLVSFSLFSQEDQSTLSFGVKAGMAVSSFSTEQPHTGERIGYTLGGFVGYALNSQLSLQGEVNYLQQGGTLLTYTDETRFGAPYNFATVHQTHSRVTLHNVEVPILVQYKVPFGELPVKAFAGPSLAYTFKATENFERTGYTASNLIVTATGSEDVSSQYEPFQLGVTGGLGFYIPYGDKSLVLDVRYRYGVTPARSSYSYIELNGTAEAIRTNTLSVTLGLIL